MGRIIGLTFEEAVEAIEEVAVEEEAPATEEAVEAIEEVAVEEEAPATEEAVEKEPKKSTKKGK